MAQREQSNDSPRRDKPAIVSLHTRELDTREGHSQWASTLGHLYGEMDIAWPDPRQHFDAEWGGRPFGDLHVSSIRADAHTVVRSPTMIESDGAAGYLVCIITDGHVEVEQGGRTAFLERGSFTLLDCGAPFVFHSPTPFRQVVVRSPHELLTSRLPGRFIENGTARAIDGASTPGGLVGRLLVDIADLENPMSEGAAASFASSAVDMLATALTEGALQTSDSELHRTQDLMRVQRVIEQNLHDADLTLSDIAASAGMSLRTVHKLFSVTGTTTQAWLFHARLERARKYLLTTELSIAELSECVGFRDVSHFSRTFRSTFGTSPGQYRKDFAAGGSR